jgi:hypothetical protein
MLRRVLRDLSAEGYRVSFLWCPAHVGIRGNEDADVLAKEGPVSGELSLLPLEVGNLVSELGLRIRCEWQRTWDAAETGRYTYLIFSRVLSKAWFKGLQLPRSVIVTTSRMMLNHYALNAHMYRFDIVDSPMCDCGSNYQTIDHVFWECPLRQEGRDQLVNFLTALNLIPGEMRYLLCLNDLTPECYIRLHTFLRRHKLHL